MFPSDVGAAATPLPRLPSELVGTPTPPAGETRGPQLIHSGPGSSWIPQGQGYDAGRGEILTSYYGGRSDGVLLSIQSIGQDPDSGGETHSVILGADRGDGGLFASGAAPNKGGGVATNGEYVYLADTEAVYVYRRSDIEATASTCALPVDPVHVIDMPDGVNASYLTVHDDKLYVGEFAQNMWDPLGMGPDETPQLLRFDIDASDGSFGARGEDGGFAVGTPTGSIDTPDNAQGVAITDDGLLYTTSYSNDRIASPHHLVFQAFEGDPADFRAESPDDASKVYDLDYYAEGVNIVDGEVWVTYESGADKYRGKAEEDRDHIQRIPLGDLDDY